MRGLPDCCSFPPLSPGHRPCLPSLALGDTLSLAPQEPHSPFLLLSDPEGKCPSSSHCWAGGSQSWMCFSQLLALPWRSCQLARATLSHSTGPPLTTPLCLFPSHPFPLGEVQRLAAQRPAGILDPADPLVQLCCPIEVAGPILESLCPSLL